MEYKGFPVDDLEFKSDGEHQGYFRARVAAFNNVDDGGDRIIPGAFKRALKANPRPPVIWNHDWNLPPIGQTLKASESDQGLEIEGKLLLDDKGISGQYAHSIMSGFKIGALKEFSFGYEASDTAEVKEGGVTIRELREIYPLFEVSPTLVGMNRDTALLEVAGRNPSGMSEFADLVVKKLRDSGAAIGYITYSAGDEITYSAGDEITVKAAIASHSTGTTEGTWDGNAAMSAANSAADYRAICAWYSGTNPDERGSYKFPHHRTPGAPAVLAGVRNALARVPQANIPSSDVPGVKAHLQQHLDDAKSMNDAEEAAAPSPEDERRAAQLAEINRLKHLIPR